MNVGVNVAIIEDGQILLTKREDFEVWCMPGGGADPGESMTETAVREVLEEIGLHVHLTHLVGVYSIPEAKAWLNLILLFVGEVVGGELKAQKGEVLEIRYFPVDALPENMLWGHRQRVMDAVNGCGGSVVWQQNVPFDAVENRQELYQLRDESGLSGHEFYLQHFGWNNPDGDKQEIA